jgi:hypothetical protein
MRIKVKSFFLLIPVLFFPFYLGAQDNGNIDIPSVMNALKSIKQKHEETQKTGRTKLLQEITAAAASPATAMSFYEEAVRATRFEGQNRENTQFNEWKHKGRDADRLKDKNWQEAVRLHLAYLAITLQRSAGTETKDLLTQLLNYTKQIIAEQDLLEDQDEMMNHPLADSVFVRWLQIGDQLTNLDKWEMAPGNLNGIFLKSILPELRKLKDPRAIEYWDLRIQREGNQASASRRNFDLDKFNQMTRPKLLWNRAQEMLAIGQKGKAVAEMLAIIKSNPAHPSVDNWIENLEKLLKDHSQTTTYEPIEENN